jgi:hypothetical protein
LHPLAFLSSPVYSRWSTRKIVIVGLSAFLLLATLVIVPTVLGVLLTRSTGKQPP